jgi:murein L,D-transpeptidase YcbB/YkuD
VGRAGRTAAESWWLVGLIALAGGLAAPMSTPVAGSLAAARHAAADPSARALVAALAGSADAELAQFYAQRAYRPLWIDRGALRPEARALVSLVADAAADGLDPAEYDVAGLGVIVARARKPADLARAELALSRAAAAYGADLHRPNAGAELLYPDPALPAPAISRRQVLERLAAGRTLAQGLAAMRSMNPIYERLRVALARARAEGSPDVGRLRVNLERARALPAEFGERYVLVDVAAQRLHAYERGREVDSMKVVVGKAAQPTPGMAALIRYAVFRPYWNVPPDMVAQSVAPKVLQEGPGYLRSQRLEALSDWSQRPTALDPAQIDWRAVATGQRDLRVRQSPGGDNTMGQVKFMFPNDLGVYLHDSPERALFAGAERLASAGCVRLEAAPRLARWLLGEAVVAAGRGPGPPETRVDLPRPAPVYIVYFTALPTPGGIEQRRDIYGRDGPLLAALGDKVLRLAAR